MENVIGIKVRDRKGKWFGFMSYPEIYTDAECQGEILLDIARPFMKNLEGMDEPVELLVFPSVRSVEGARYFYQGLFTFAWNRRPSGDAYNAWRAKVISCFRKRGDYLYFLGPIEE